MTTGKEVKVFRSVDAIGRDPINSMTDDAFFTYEWFKTLESQQSFAISPIYFAVYDQGTLVAFAPCFIDLLDQYFHYAQQNPIVLSSLKKMLSFGSRIGFCQEHVLICYSPLSYRSKILIENTSEKKHLLSLLVKKIDDFCKKERILFSSFLFVSEYDKLLMDNLQNFDYLKSSGLTNFYLDVQWSSFDDYLKSFNCKLRKNIKREIRKCVENGFTIQKLEFEDLPGYVSELNSNLNLKYNTKVTSYNSFLSKLNEYAGNKTKVFIAKKDNIVVGFSLNMLQGNILDTCFTGFKYDILTTTDFIYFNVCFYEPIRWAIKKGVKKIYYRDRGEKVKLHRGCKPENTCSFVKCHDGLLGVLINKAYRTPLCSYLSQRELKGTA